MFNDQELQAAPVRKLRKFKKEELHLEAITHKSFAYENPMSGNHNEKLEFLGDSIISTVVADYLYTRFPNYNEGQLTMLRAKLICKETLAQFAVQIGLDNELRLGIGALSANARNSKKILEDTFEAYVGAIFLDADKNYAVIREFMEPLLTSKVDHLERIPPNSINNTVNIHPIGPIDESVSKNLPHEDPISKLQTWSQRRGFGLPRYKEVKVEGFVHNPRNPKFTLEVLINGKIYGSGTARNKKDAKKYAAISTLKEILGE